MSGSIDNLRKQTRDRFCADLMQSQGVNWKVLDYTSNPDYLVDIKTQEKYMACDMKLNNLGNSTWGARYVTVCLKNSTRLERLINWLHSDPVRAAKLRQALRHEQYRLRMACPHACRVRGIFLGVAMKYRGKGINWTEAEDKAILEGKMPSGRVPSQVYNRRSKLKKNFGNVTRQLCRTLLWRLDYMARMGLFLDSDKKFFDGIVSAIKKKVL
jgi:hypothetical protein